MGKDPKMVHLSSGLPCKFTCLAIFSFDLASQNLRSWTENLGNYSVPYICKVLSKRHTEALTRQDNFICVPFYNSGTEFDDCERK